MHYTIIVVIKQVQIGCQSENNHSHALDLHSPCLNLKQGPEVAYVPALFVCVS